MSNGTTALRVGLLGNGAIGRAILRFATDYATDIEVVGVLTRSRASDANPPVVDSVDDLLALELSIVVEAAGHGALREHGATILAHGCDLIALSVGALADRELEQRMSHAMVASGARLHIASGAIGALDAIGAAAVGGLTSVVHTTRKPARSLMSADEAAALTEPREIFVGPAREAALLFPENVNVSAAVSLAGIGFDRTMVRIIADPAATRNVHLVEAEGTFGTLRFEINNIPSDDNPKSARLAAMSAVHTLLQCARERRSQHGSVATTMPISTSLLPSFDGLP